MIAGGSLSRRLRNVAEKVADVLLPPACVGCREALPSGTRGAPVCARCRTRLRRPPAPRCTRCDLPLGTGRSADAPCPECGGWPGELSAARCAVALQPPADALVHGLKYEGWWTLADVMADRLAALATPDLLGDVETTPPLVVAVPTTRERIRSRGYNQAELLARGVARRRGWARWDGLVRRSGGTTQVSLHPLERRANVNQAFVVPDPRGIVARHVFLVDDVLTTGATAGEAARVLVEAGAGTVTLIAFGRALPRSP